MPILLDEFNKSKDFWLNSTVFQIIINISSPISCSKLFSSLWFWKLMLYTCCFWQEDFYINVRIRTIWPKPVAIFKVLYIFIWSPSSQKLLDLQSLIPQKKYWKKVTLVYVVQIFSNSESVNMNGPLWRPLVPLLWRHQCRPQTPESV